ncbi:hypothetical protein PHLCEN_2v9059 [Hermanssonia centrifuga]|uniref:Thg1 C-terminal domain-containing protein n=1 Tax=Hermanssonia centrifuga TaxID=98765 RepID=A0A2R6NS24_9APHY|nr:hypothetical protein PHLCEN_2v9059 [Hermanssonia centrifuga]
MTTQASLNATETQLTAHINNLYNTVFWALVQQAGETTTQAHAILRGTVSKQKHEILFSRFGLNYNGIGERYRKGSILVREEKVRNKVRKNLFRQMRACMNGALKKVAGERGRKRGRSHRKQRSAHE